MTKATDQAAAVLEPIVPHLGASVTTVPVNDTLALLPPEMRADHSAALERLARQQQKSPPRDGQLVT
jgi:hypothetical protein